MSELGYLLHRPEGFVGEHGQFYDYVLAGNGVFIQVEGKLLAARIPIAETEIRGLAPLEPKVVLRHGLVPSFMFDLVVNTFLTDTSREKYMAITWNDGYHIVDPEQKREPGSLEYQVPENVVVDIHSHGKMGAFFSGDGCMLDCQKCQRVHCDTRDDKGLGLHTVVGNCHDVPVVKLRVGVYGYFYTISWGDVFAGPLNGVVEWSERAELEAELLESEFERKEGIEADDLPSDAVGYPDGEQHHRGWLRWNWGFRR